MRITRMTLRVTAQTCANYGYMMTVKHLNTHIRAYTRAFVRI